MRKHSVCRGFTLIELIATITIIAILAAVALPRTTAAQPFQERGYADALAASVRQARAVAVASGCEVQFSVDAAGYRARQHGAAAPNHCAASGAWPTVVSRGDGAGLEGTMPGGVALAANRQFVFAADGSVAGAPFTVTVGPHAVTVEASGLVH